MTLAQYIRSQFPSPVRAVSIQTTDNPACYCVGGALLLYKKRLHLAAGVPDFQRFPDPAEIASVLREYNPRITLADARTLARQLTSENDTGAFECAWSTLEYALEGCVDHP